MEKNNYSSDYIKGAYPWQPDNGDGTYNNPVLFADYSDPDVIRVGEDYYLTASSFNQSPGLPVLHSKDLVNWTIISYAITQPPGVRYEEMQPGCGVWAPAIRHHDGKFWIFFPMPDEGIFVTNAENPAGPWAEPWCLQEGKGLIDPCPLWDDDGTAWLIFAYAKSRCGIKHKLHMRPMSPDARSLTGPGKIVFDGTADHPTLEGPKMHKFDDYYYISAPAGGVPRGWQVVLRSKNIYGPYEESKIVLEQNGSIINGPHQGALVDDIEGDWWFLHFQEHQPYGRICHLQPVQWKDGWPMAGELSEKRSSGRPVLRHAKPAGSYGITMPQTSDEFDSPELGLQWAAQGTLKPEYYSLTDRPGRLRLNAVHRGKSELHTAPHVMIQKTPCRTFTVETEIDFHTETDGMEAGLAVLGLSTASLALHREDGKNQLIHRLDDELFMSEPITVEGPVKLVLNFGNGGFCQFGYREGEGTVWFGPSFQAREGKWIGARVGLYCTALGPLPIDGYADFGYFRFS